MTDETTDFERITQALPNHTGEAWSPERTRADFHLFSHTKRAETLDVIDDHLRRADPSNLRKYAGLTKLRRDLVATHTTLRKAGR